ncbi:uncharacterized protein BDR25DRAFT_241597, partial [Lindgomyces ingoldianus]
MAQEPHAPLRILHYLSPFAIAVSATLFSALAVCFVPPSNRLIRKKSKQAVSKWLALVLCCLYIAEGLLCVQRAFTNPRWSATRDSMEHIALSTVVWIVAFIILRESATLYWPSCLGSWALGTTMEVAIFALLSRSWSGRDDLDITRMALHATRIFCLVLLCLSAVFSWTKRPSNLDTESDPLLGPAPTSPYECVQYGSIPSDTKLNDGVNDQDDEGESAKNKLAEQQLQRLEVLGGWWAYLKQFRVFLPHTISHSDSRMQCYAIGVLFCLLIERVANVLSPHYLGVIVDKISSSKETGQLPLKDIFFLIFVIKVPHETIFVPIRDILSTRLYFWSYGKVLVSSYSHMLGLFLEFQENKDTRKVLKGVEQAQTLNRLVYQLAMDVIPAIVDVIVAIGYLSYIFDFQLGTIILVTGICYVIVTHKFTITGAQRQRPYIRTGQTSRKLMHEYMSFWQSTIYFNQQAYEKSRLQATANLETYSMAKLNELSQFKYVAQCAVVALGYVSILLLGAYQVTSKGHPVGNMATLLFYWSILTRPIASLAQRYKDMVDWITDGERLLQLWYKRPCINDTPDAQALEVNGGKIEYKDVKFSYDNNNQIVNGISFTAEAGSTVVIVGETRSGKSTACNKLLLRLYDVSHGSILIDGQDIRDITQYSLREAIGIVPQDPSFPNQTIMDIVRYARLEASDAEVYEACKAAAIHDMIMGFPNQYQSKVGERGVKVSSDGKQRLAIAQLFLKNPKIIVLDEVTSSMDPPTETETQDSFAQLTSGRTTLLIGLCPSTVVDADLILVLHKGEIVERGTHNELLQNRGQYYRLWAKESKKQFLE